MEVDDSLKASVDLFGYLSQSEAGGGISGQPLGAGGKLPLAYDLSLYREDPANKPYSYQKDLWPQYQDFSYIPTWQPNQLEARLNYRFFPRVWGVASLYFNDDPAKADAKIATQPLQLGEFFLKWGSESVPGLSFSMGKLKLWGDYSPIFDQFPLENFSFSGLAAHYNHSFEGGNTLRLRLAAGKEFLGRTQSLDSYISADRQSQGSYFIFLDGIRERYHFYTTACWEFPNGFYLGGLAGYQMLPKDSTYITELVNVDIDSYRIWPKSNGWQMGGDAGYRSKTWQHHMTLSYGKNDVEMGWSRPDAVEDFSLDTASILSEQRFSRMGSSLFQAVYWMEYQGRRFHMEGGAWWHDRMPAKRGITTILSSGDGSYDTVLLQAQEFRTIKYSLQPSLDIVGPLSIGLRYDHIQYFDPNGHSNTVEPLTNSALQPIIDSTGGRVWGPSLWDREAVNCDILSPYLELNLESGFKVRASWSGAWYQKSVWRQGSVDSFHANATLSAWLTYHFAQSQPNTSNQIHPSP